MYDYVNVCLYVYVHEYMYVYIRVYMYVYIHGYVYIYAYINVYMYMIYTYNKEVIIAYILIVYILCHHNSDVYYSLSYYTCQISDPDDALLYFIIRGKAVYDKIDVLLDIVYNVLSDANLGNQKVRIMRGHNYDRCIM